MQVLLTVVGCDVQAHRLIYTTESEWNYFHFPRVVGVARIALSQVN